MTSQRNTWAIPPESFVVGIVARLAPVKNHGLLLRAVAKLGPNVHLAIVGGGPSRDALVALAQECGISSRVHFIGEIHGPMNLHNFFDVTVLCSLSEGFPNSIIEALAAARPVVATSVGGVPDVIVDNETGLLIKSQSVDELAAALKRLQHDAALRERLARAGQRSVRLQFHQDIVMNKLSALYSDLAA